MCVTQALEVEREPEVRRAAVLVVKTTLSDLGHDAVQVSPPPSLAVCSTATVCSSAVSDVPCSCSATS